jgi:hypothetical protein
VRKLLFATALIAAPLAANADVIYTLGTDNTAAQGPGPWGFVDVHLNSSTLATITFTANTNLLPTWDYAFTEMGVNVNATSFTTTTPTGIVLDTGSSLPASWSQVGPSTLDGFGKFNIDWKPTPNGASDSMLEAMFTVTNTSGTWANQDAVLSLDNMNHYAAAHSFTNGNSSFSADSSHCDTGTTGCDAPPPSIAEPASLALLSAGLFGLGFIRSRRSKS